MPVRSRSRVSSAVKNSPASSDKERSSSNSASNPLAITPPSRTTLAGSSAIACVRKCRQSGDVLSVSLMSLNKCDSEFRDRAALMAGNCCKPARNPDRSLGRAESKAIRLAIRSISGITESCSVNESPMDSSSKEAIAACRARAIA